MRPRCCAVLLPLLFLGLLLAAIASCGPAEPPPAVAPQARQANFLLSACTGDVPQFSDDGFQPPWYAPNTFIVSGPRGDVDLAIDELIAAMEIQGEAQICQRDRLRLADVKWDTTTCAGVLPPRFDEYVIDLYQITPGAPILGHHFLVLGATATETVPPEVAAVLWIDLNQHGRAAAELSIEIGGPANGLEGDPMIGAGSPWMTSIIPFTSQDGNPGEAFWSQWALAGDNGIKLMSGGKRTTVQTGAGVRIGVFDSSPFPAAGSYKIDWFRPPAVQENEAASAAASWSLTVKKPTEHFSWPPPHDKLKLTLESHGLFVAGLAHAVAPAAEIQLYQVLDEYVRGHLFSLEEALYLFAQETLSRPPPGFRGAVVNLSLGFHPPHLAQVTWSRYGLKQWMVDGLRRTSPSLDLLLQAAQCSRFVVVAAAGNDSSRADPQGTQYPASFDPALAVASTSAAGTRSCFSNQGEIGAPGGGDPKLVEVECVPAQIVGSDRTEMHNSTILGPVRKKKGLSLGYAYWAGTSFSTPLVSGIAALEFEGEVGRATAREVQAEITTNAMQVGDSSLGNRRAVVSTTAK